MKLNVGFISSYICSVKLLVAGILMLFCHTSNAQKFDDDGVFVPPSDSATYVMRFDNVWRAPLVGYGYRRVVKHGLSRYFQTRYNSSFGFPFLDLSIQYGGPMNWGEDIRVVVHYFPKNTLQTEYTNYEFSGFSVDLSLGPGINLMGKFKDVDLIVGLGEEIGCMYMNRYDLRYRNFFFSPTIHISPRVLLLKRVVLETTLKGGWDVTRFRWRSRGDAPDARNMGWKNTYWLWQVKIGFITQQYKRHWLRYYK